MEDTDSCQQHECFPYKWKPHKCFPDGKAVRILDLRVFSTLHTESFSTL